MLVMSRYGEEDVVVGEGPDATTVRVVRVKGDRVWLGFSAPAHVRVDRAEVRARREAEALENETRKLCVGEGLA